jgi:hypothetical protein
VRSDGRPIAIEAADEATPDGVLAALSAWSVVPYDLSVRARTRDSDDGLVRSVQMVGFDPEPTGPRGADRASGVSPGTVVEFLVEVDPSRARPGVAAHVDLEILDDDLLLLDEIELTYERPLGAFGACREDASVP